MNPLEPLRKTLNAQITPLRELLTSGEHFDDSIALFLRVHAQLHSASVSNSGEWSFEDALLDDLSETQFRRIPKNEDGSLGFAVVKARFGGVGGGGWPPPPHTPKSGGLHADSQRTMKTTPSPGRSGMSPASKIPR